MKTHARRILWATLGIILFSAAVADAQDDYTMYRPRKVLYLAAATDNFFNNEYTLDMATECQADAEQREARQAANQATEKDVTCNKAVFILAEIVSLWSGGTALPADAVVSWCLAAEIWQQIRMAVIQWAYDEWARVGSERLLNPDEVRDLRARMSYLDQMEANGSLGYLVFLISTGLANVTTSWVI